MYNLSQNYYLRKEFFQRDSVPTQSLIQQKMAPALANVYFKSMTPNLKVLAGLEPPLQGGGSDWYMPPEEILKGKAVLKPLKEELKEKLNFIGIDTIGMKLTEKQRKKNYTEKIRLLEESDISWRKKIIDICDYEHKERAELEAEHNTKQMQIAMSQFTSVYSTSVTKLEDLLLDAAVEKIKEVRENTFQIMCGKYEHLLKQQSVLLYDEYNAKLSNEKARLKAEFMENIQKLRTKLSDKLHQINLEKHIAIEKSRKYLECQNLACRVYIALKERHECLKETEYMERRHAKTAKILRKKLLSTDLEVRLLQEREENKREFNALWMTKVGYIVKHFQLFVSYSLSKLPEYADFFINLERLLLLQISNIIEDPYVDSIFIKEFEEQDDHNLVSKPQPFYLFCDQNNNPSINENLCPKHCSSSASQLPVIIIDKTCIYAACDNFEQFTDKIKDYLLRNYETDDNLIDSHNYNHDVPVEYRLSQQLLELKLASSINGACQFQLQHEYIYFLYKLEIANIKNVPIECVGCGVPHCFGCSHISSSPSASPSAPATEANKSFSTVYAMPVEDKILCREAEICYEREPKWASYMQYVKPRKCNCPKLAKRHLLEHLPAYMRTMSHYDPPELLNYETCSTERIKTLVRKARCKKNMVSLPRKVSKTRDVGTQTDDEFNILCTCLSDDAVNEFYLKVTTREDRYYDKENLKVLNSLQSQTYLTKDNVILCSPPHFGSKTIDRPIA